VLRDEVRHRDFGWALLRWQLDSAAHGERLRGLVVRELPASFARLRTMYASGGVPGDKTMPREDARWGLMAPARYGEVLRTTFERDYVPRFARLAVDARTAWDD